MNLRISHIFSIILETILSLILGFHVFIILFDQLYYRFSFLLFAWAMVLFLFAVLLLPFIGSRILKLLKVERIVRKGHITTAGVLSLVIPYSLILTNMLLGRMLEFKLQAYTGQPIVKAIENFKEKNGYYPDSLQQLVPAFLRGKLDLYGSSKYPHGGWEYSTVLKNGQKTYTLRYYMVVSRE